MVLMTTHLRKLTGTLHCCVTRTTVNPGTLYIASCYYESGVCYFPSNKKLDLVRCFAFDTNRATLGNVLLNVKRKIRYLLSSIM